MEEIQVGEYVRTYNGLIGKIVQITDSGNYAIRIYNGAEYVVRAVIVKHSKNIIDLIEIGDFVNGNKVYKVTNTCIYFIGKAVQNKLTVNIQTILTHEQYESNCYRIGE